MNNEKLWDLVQEVRSGGEGTIELSEDMQVILDMFNLKKEDIQNVIFNPGNLAGIPINYWRGVGFTRNEA